MAQPLDAELVVFRGECRLVGALQRDERGEIGALAG